MAKARDKAGKKGDGQGSQASKAKERGERARLRKGRERNSASFCSNVDDREFEAQLEQVGCKIKYISGDGNCLFRSLADQLEGKPEGHHAVRAKIMKHLEDNREVFEPYVEDDEAFDDYLDRMRGDAEWGGNQELVAASQLYKTNIVVHQFKAPRFFIPFEKARLTIHLSYHGEHHYNSVRALRDEDNGPALPIKIQAPTPGQTKGASRAAGTGSPWPEEEALVLRSCPWASPANIVEALDSTGGREEDAVELLIAARNEPALAETSARNKGTDNVSKALGSTSRAGDGNTRKAIALPNGRIVLEGSGGGDNATDKSSKSSKKGKSSAASKKIARASDCPCRSGLKYGKCCRKKDAAIARGQVTAPDPESVPAALSYSSVTGDLGLLVI